ncbi:MAG: energy transducer TonB, partial [Pseudomonadota bacterium]
LESRQAARQKLAEHRFYPPEAIARGLQGEVRLLLTLSPAGDVLEARIAGSSGHPLLDRAATEAVYAMQRLSADGVRELILPVIFRLQ